MTHTSRYERWEVRIPLRAKVVIDDKPYTVVEVSSRCAGSHVVTDGEVPPPLDKLILKGRDGEYVALSVVIPATISVTNSTLPL